jgi:ABC-2 type transport system permease protein
MINSLVISYVSWEIVDQIREGFFSNFLVKPVNYLHYWFTMNLSGKLLEGLFILVVVALMSFALLSQITLPAHGLTVIYFLVSLALGLVLAFEFDFCIGLIAFWLVQVKVFKYMLQYIIFFFAGALLPLDLFPKPLQTLAYALPFQYLVFFPIQIFLEKETAPLPGFLVALLWIGALYLLSRFFLIRGIRKYEAVGN